MSEKVFNKTKTYGKEIFVEFTFRSPIMKTENLELVWTKHQLFTDLVLDLA